MNEGVLPPEEAARAQVYGILARLYLGPPDPALCKALGRLGGEVQGEGEFALAVRELANAAAGLEAESVREEYETLFGGPGKPALSLYAGTYVQRSSADVPLAELRSELIGLGLQRMEGVNEPEDHFAALCEVMRRLIEEGDSADIGKQRRFFERWLLPTAHALCTAIDNFGDVGFYRYVARVTVRFVDIEHQAFGMD